MEAIRQWLRDAVPTSTRLRAIQAMNRLGGNYLSRPLYGKATYNQDGMATTHNADFMVDPRFAAAYDAGRATGSWTFGRSPLARLRRVLGRGAGAHLDGDFVECGVNRGGYALMVVRYLDFEELPKRFYLLDTYEGLVEQLISPEEKAHGVRVGEYEPCYEAVVRTFTPYDNVEIVKGAVPGHAPAGRERAECAFLSLDMNTRDPEIAAAEYFWDKLVSGWPSSSTTTAGASTSNRSGPSMTSPVSAASRCCPYRPAKG